MKQALIVIDVQNDYFPGGAMTLVNMAQAAANCQRLLNRFRDLKAPVFHVQHIMTRAGATFFLPDTFGCEIHESVQPHEDESLIVKHYPNCFRQTSLSEQLTQVQVQDVVICGAMTHMCVDSSTRAAFDLGYNCTVIDDACATRNLVFNNQQVSAADVQAAFMAALSVPFAAVLSTQQFLEDEV